VKKNHVPRVDPGIIPIAQRLTRVKGGCHEVRPLAERHASGLDEHCAAVDAHDHPASAPHHRGTVDMSVAEPRYGRKEQPKPMTPEIVAMDLAFLLSDPALVCDPASPQVAMTLTSENVVTTVPAPRG